MGRNKVGMIQVIRTQEDLDRVMAWEQGKYYLVLNGEMYIADEYAPWFNELEALANLKAYFKTIPGRITKLKLMTVNNVDKFNQLYKRLFQAYIAPWRYH